MARKTFILGSNALASAPEACLRFDDNDVVIPGCVIDELGKLATQYNEKGKNASMVLKYLESFKFSDLISKNGVRQKTGGALRVIYDYGDNNIEADDLTLSQRRRLQVARNLVNAEKSTVILISRNPAFRLKAKSLGIRAVDFKDEVFPLLEDQYKGRIRASINTESKKYFENHGFLEIKKIHKYTTYDWLQNIFVELHDVNSPSDIVIGRFDGEKIVSLKYGEYHPYGITPKNIGQSMLIESMMESPENAPLVIVKGGAGTGKTYQALACALEQTQGNPEAEVYEQILLSTSTSTVGGEKIGFLPGEIENKFSPYIGGLLDNLRLLLKQHKKGKKEVTVEDVNYFFEKGIIQMQPLAFFRGRTITNSFIIIDECQNIHPDDMKTIISRAAEGSKICCLGDPTQIDHPMLDERYNGLVFLSEKMKGYEGAWQTTMDEEESVRSKLAKYAAKVL